MGTIEDARNVVREVQADLDKERQNKDRRKAQTKEKRVFDSLPEQTKIEFWCRHCQIDFVAPAYRIWSEVHQLGSWQSFCPRCEGLVYRHVNSKTLDPYYEESLKVRVMRSEGEADMLSPHQYGFRTLYGDPFESYYRQFQEQEESLHNRYATMGLTGLTVEEKSEREKLDFIKEYEN